MACQKVALMESYWAVMMVVEMVVLSVEMTAALMVVLSAVSKVI